MNEDLFFYIFRETKLLYNLKTMTNNTWKQLRDIQSLKSSSCTSLITLNASCTIIYIKTVYIFRETKLFYNPKTMTSNTPKRLKNIQLPRKSNYISLMILNINRATIFILTWVVYKLVDSIFLEKQIILRLNQTLKMIW